MVYTPFPPEIEEHPCIVRSVDGITFLDEGIKNPIIRTEAIDTDPDFIYLPDKKTWILAWAKYSHYEDKIGIASSKDGINWDIEKYIGGIEEWEIEREYSMLSQPSLFYEDGVIYLYYSSIKRGNNEGEVGLITLEYDKDNLRVLERKGSILSPLQSENYRGGCGHLDISHFKDRYLMLCLRKGSNDLFDLFLYGSKDKIEWNLWTILVKSVELYNFIYRSCFLTNKKGEVLSFDGRIRLYYSAYRLKNGVWIPSIEMNEIGEKVLGV